MKYFLMVLGIFLLVAPKAYCQPDYQWHTFYGSNIVGAAGTDRAYAVTFDTGGNTYTTGMSESNWTDPGIPAPLHAHSGVTNVFILKLNNAGVYQWHTFFGGADVCYGFDITIDTGNNLYVTGFSNSTWNGPLAEPPLNPYSGSTRDFFVLKLNSAGVYQWHTFFGGANTNEGSGIACDNVNNVYVSGFSDNGWNGPLAEPPINGHAGGRDLFILKLDPAGAYQWHTFHGSAGNDESFNIDTDANNSVVAGGYSDAAWNGPGAQPPLHPHSGGKDSLVLKLDSAGAYQWHTFYGSAASDEARGIRTDPTGNVYACGNSSGTWQGDGGTDPLHAYSGSADHMILKLNASGVYLWHTFYGTNADNDYANDLVLDVNNDVYIAGRSYGTWQGDGGEEPLHAFSGFRDIAVMKLDTNGGYEWHTFYGAINGDDRGQDTVLHNGALYVVGRSSATWTGDGGNPPLHAFAGGPGDAYILRFDVPLLFEAATPVPDAFRMGYYSFGRSAGRAVDSHDP